MLPTVGTRLTCRYQGADRVGFISGVYADGSFDVAIMAPTVGLTEGWQIAGGLTKPQRAMTESDKLVDGHWWQS